MINKKNKMFFIKGISLAIALAFVMNVSAYALNTNENLIDDSTFEISEKFIAESEYSVISDSNGDPVIVLTNVQPLSYSRSAEKQYAQTTVAILPTDQKEAIEIIESIDNLTRGSGSYNEDGWFYGSSVYLSSTIYYTTSTVSGIDYGGITSVSISSSVNSGTSIGSLSLLMGQIGFASNGGYKNDQSTTFDAMTTSTFTAPSSWVPVMWDSEYSDVGAHLTCTAVRAAGQSTFTLYNSII